MSKFDQIVTQLIKDLNPLRIPREQYLALCVEERMKQNLEKYESDFNKLLNTFEKETFYEADLSKLLKTIQSFSKLIDHLYSNLIRVIEYQETLFKD